MAWARDAGPALGPGADPARARDSVPVSAASRLLLVCGTATRRIPAMIGRDGPVPGGLIRWIALHHRNSVNRSLSIAIRIVRGARQPARQGRAPCRGIRIVRMGRILRIAPCPGRALAQ